MRHDPRQGPIEVPVGAIAPDPDQPRSTIAPEDLAALAASIRANRVIQPIVVTEHPCAGSRQATPYMILVGERRWRAAQLAGLATVPAVVRGGEMPAFERLLLQLAENDERTALSLLDRARAYRRACELSGLSRNAFARRCGKSTSFLSQLLRLTEAEGALRDALEERLINQLDVVRAFEQLPAEAQRRVVDAARREGRPITPRRLQEALAGPAEGQAMHEADSPPERACPAAPAGSTASGRASHRKRAAGPDPLTVPLTFAELRNLLRFLGARPLSTPAAAIGQLQKLVAAMAGGTDEMTQRRRWTAARRKG